MFLLICQGIFYTTFSVDEQHFIRQDWVRSDWFCIYVKYLYDPGMTSGCGYGTYSPNVVINRAQMAGFPAKTIPGMKETPISNRESGVIPLILMYYHKKASILVRMHQTLFH
ncbi:MAG: S-layer homology domain-containing protein [Proteobacteria bacterium]|nr:S-layer homology domain-containing protein [Pseudomonadota bacterium]